MKNFFIITRFNLPLWNKDKNNCSTNTDSWLENRFELFEGICYPSVLHQTDQNFYWFVLFDKNTPIKFKDRIQNLAHNYINFYPCFLNIEDSNNIVKYLNNKITSIRSVGYGTITLRLDNDDAIHKEFVENVKSHLNDKLREVTFLSFKYGLQYFVNENLAFRIPYPNNHFLAKYEPKDSEISTVYSDNHFFISKSSFCFICIDNKTQPLWVETIHNSNVDNDLKITFNIKPIFSNDTLFDFGIFKQFTQFYVIKKFFIFFIPRFVKQFFRRLILKLKFW